MDSKEPPTCMVSKALSTIDPNQAAFAFGSGTLQGHLLVPYSGLEVVNLSLVHYIERHDAMLWGCLEKVLPSEEPHCKATCSNDIMVLKLSIRIQSIVLKEIMVREAILKM